MTRETSQNEKVVFLSDPSGVVSGTVNRLAERLGVRVREFGQPGLLAATAARERVDLVIIAGPRSLAPLDRLHNDPRTRGIPVLLISSELSEEEARFKALAITDQILDFPPEEGLLEARIEQLLSDRGSPSGLRDYATAHLEHEATALWVGRICWVQEQRLVLETDIELPEGAEGPLAGPALTFQGSSAAWVRVVAADTENLHYNYAVNLELELLHPAPNLMEGLLREPHCQASRKTRLTLLADDSATLTSVAQIVDHERYSLRWVRQLDALARHVGRMHPALILIDPRHPELGNPSKFGILRQLPDSCPPLLPIEAPDDPAPWERLGARCARLDPPPLDDAEAFSLLIEGTAEDSAPPPAAGRVYLKREHPFSHARLSVPAKLAEMSEMAGKVRFGHRVHAGGRLRLDVPDLQRAGLRPLYGRVLDTVRPDERAPVLWMGFGGEVEARKVRSHVQGVIMEARRREYSKQEPEGEG